MKTSSIYIYTPHGSRSATRVAEVRYRGKLLQEWYGFEEPKLLDIARKWSSDQGFRGTKVFYVVGG